MDPPREEKRKTVPQKSKDPLSLDEEPLRIRQKVAASRRKEIKNFLEKLTTDVKCEIQFLQDMLDYHSSNNEYPFESSEAVENFAREWIGLNISKKEMWTLINKLKEKCEKRAKQFYEESCFMSDDEGEAFELGKKMWGSEIKAIPTEEEPIIALRNPIAIDPPTPFISSNVQEGVGEVQEEDGAKLEKAGLKEAEEEWSPIRSPTSSLSGNVQQGVGPVQRAIGATASFGGLQEEQIIAPRNLTAMDLPTPFLSSSVLEGVGTILGPVSSGIGVTASYQGVQEEVDVKLDDLPDDSFLHCNESFHELINGRAVLPSDQPRMEEGEKDLSLFHPTIPVLPSNVPEGDSTILGPEFGGISLTASYDGVEKEDDTKLEGLLDESFLLCSETYDSIHPLINEIEVFLSDQPMFKEGEEDLSPIPEETSCLSSNVPEVVGPIWSVIVFTTPYGGLQEDEQKISPRNTTVIHPPTPFLSSNLPEGVGSNLGAASSGIDVTALYGAMEEGDDIKLIHALINQSEVLPSDQPRQKEGEEDLTSIPPPTCCLSSSVPEGTRPVWREIGVTASHSGLQEEEQISGQRNCTAIHLPTPLLSNNVPEGLDTIPGFVSSGRGPFDGVQEEKDAELEALIAFLFPNNEEEVQTNCHAPLNEGGEENYPTIQPPTSSLSTSGTENRNEHAADEMGKKY